MAEKGKLLLSQISLTALIRIGKTNCSTRKKSTWGQLSGGQLRGMSLCGQQLRCRSLVANKANKGRTGKPEKAGTEQG